MVFELSPRSFLLLQISLGTRGGQSLLFQSGNQLMLLKNALFAVGDKLEEQRPGRFMTSARHDGSSCSSCEASSWQVSCGSRRTAVSHTAFKTRCSPRRCGSG